MLMLKILQGRLVVMFFIFFQIQRHEKDVIVYWLLKKCH